MLDPLEHQAIIDDEHLKLLSLGYLISAASSAFYSLIGLMYMFFGIMMGAVIKATPNTTGDQPPAFLGWIFGGIGFLFFLLLIAMAAVQFHAANCLKKRKSRTFCLVIAAIRCLGIPYGTAIGVFSFIVLGRPSVMRQFEAAKAQTA